MKILVIGAVAAGTSAATKARRNNPSAKITIYEKGRDISYGICGIPYFVGKAIGKPEELAPRDPAWFKEKHNIDVRIFHKVEKIRLQEKSLEVLDLKTGKRFVDPYDELVIATGARPFIPAPFLPCEDAENVFPVRTISGGVKIRNYIEKKRPQKAVIIGAGMIGLEMAEQLRNWGLDITILQKGPQVMGPMDGDMAAAVQEELERAGIRVILNADIREVKSCAKRKVWTIICNEGEELNTDMVILAAGVVPDAEIAEEAGIELGTSGAIRTGTAMETSVSGVYAAGDVAESFSVITGEAVYRPMGSTANKTGRIAGDALTGGSLRHRGVLGTGIVRVFDLTAGFCGLNERDARAAGYDFISVKASWPSNTEYMDPEEITIKALAEKDTGRLLGAQLFGKKGVDKRLDVLVAAMTYGARAEDLFHLDLAYAPPYSTVKDPINNLGMVLESALEKVRRTAGAART